MNRIRIPLSQLGVLHTIACGHSRARESLSATDFNECYL